MRAGIYARYSSDNQREESLQDQINVCMKYASQKGFIVDPANIFVDAATSGKVRDRSGLNNLLKVVREKRIDVVLIDDLSRLSRTNLDMLMAIEELKYLEIELHSIADNLNTADDESKLNYQLRGIFNEIYLDDLRKKTLRGQLGQKQRGYFLGEKTFGYKSESCGNTRIDKKGRPRPDGYKMYILEHEAAVVRRIFKMFAEKQSATKIVKTLNAEKVPSSKHAKHGWNVSTVHRILRSTKYIGKWTWGARQNKRMPVTGHLRQVYRQKPLFEAVFENLRIIPQEQWDEVQARLQEVERNWQNGKSKRGGFSRSQGSYVNMFPKELLSGAMVCSECGGTICKISGKAGGYYGCQKAAYGACNNKVIVQKNLAEPIILAEVSKILGNTTLLEYILTKVESNVTKMCDTFPEEIRSKKAELASTEKAIKNFVQHIAEGRSSKAISDSLEDAERKADTLLEELTILEMTKKNVFKAPPLEWIADRVAHVKEVLEQKTEQSALLLRKLIGKLTLQPITPVIGKPYLRARSRLQPLALFEEKRPPKGPSPSEFETEPNLELGSNSLHWWRWRP